MDNTQGPINYAWNPNDVFNFSGSEFGMQYNTLRQITDTPQFMDDLIRARATIATASMMEAMNKKLQEGIDSGLIKQVTNEQKEAIMAAMTTPAEAIQDSAVKGN